MTVGEIRQVFAAAIKFAQAHSPEDIVMEAHYTQGTPDDRNLPIGVINVRALMKHESIYLMKEDPYMRYPELTDP